MTILPLAVALQLSMALCQQIANSGDFRILFIKGPAAVAVDARPARPSTDIDVIVDPRSIESFVIQLKSRGWEERPSSDGLRPIPEHSITLFHQVWPNDIDVHFTYPGFDVIPQVLFDSLYSESISIEFANHEVSVCNQAHAMVIVAAHALRDPFEYTSKVDIEFICTSIDASISLRTKFVKIVTSLNGGVAFRPFFKLINELPIEHDLSIPHNLAKHVEWQIRTQSRHATAKTFLLMARTDFRTAIRIFITAVFPSREVLQRHGYVKNSDGILRAQLGRWSHVLRGIRRTSELIKQPGYFRTLRLARKTHVSNTGFRR